MTKDNKKVQKTNHGQKDCKIWNELKVYVYKIMADGPLR